MYHMDQVYHGLHRGAVPIGRWPAPAFPGGALLPPLGKSNPSPFQGSFSQDTTCRMLLLLLTLALAAPETDVRYTGSGSLPLGSQTLRLERQSILLPSGEVLVEGLYGPPVSDGQTLCAADETATGLGRLRCWDRSLHPTTLATGGRPGRLALGGTWLAWVASPQGLPQVFVAPVNGTQAARALTNVGLDYTPGQAPAGFVAPPMRQSLHFDGDYLRWDSAEGPKAVRWR
jgi:hypothetical protein